MSALTIADTGSPTVLALVGYGYWGPNLLRNYMELPGAAVKTVCDTRPAALEKVRQRYPAVHTTTDFAGVLADGDVEAVVIATPIATHYALAKAALEAGKHVFVEKPLALNHEQLEEVIAAQRETGRVLMPGFNRRFSPLSIAVRDFFAGRSSPIEVIVRVNAGTLKADSWYQDPEEGGWRIISEGCHFVDLIQFICGCHAVQVYAEMIGGHVRGKQNDNCAVTLKMADGSVGMLAYVANGDPYFEKERIEVFGQGRTAVIENWQSARLSGGGRTRKVSPGSSGKGHNHELAAFVAAIAQGGDGPTSFADSVAVTQATLAIEKSLCCGERVDVPVVSTV